MTVKEIAKRNAEQLIALLDGQMTQIPAQTCNCGKPVVFTGDKKRFKCTRCKTVWYLVVKVVLEKPV